VLCTVNHGEALKCDSSCFLQLFHELWCGKPSHVCMSCSESELTSGIRMDDIRHPPCPCTAGRYAHGVGNPTTGPVSSRASAHFFYKTDKNQPSLPLLARAGFIRSDVGKKSSHPTTWKLFVTNSVTPGDGFQVKGTSSPPSPGFGHVEFCRRQCMCTNYFPHSSSHPRELLLLYTFTNK